MSVGIIKYINKAIIVINHECQSDKGSSGGPILNLLNFKVIRIHKGCREHANLNVGTFFKFIFDQKEIFKENRINFNNFIEPYNIVKNTKYEKINNDPNENGFIFISETGEGKSTLINVLCNEEKAKCSFTY